MGEGETVWAEREFDGHDFRDDDLSRLRTERVVFTECDFSGVDMSEIRACRPAFRNCKFRRASLWHSTFSHCSFLGSVFTECRMRPMKLVEVDFTLAVLGGADLRGVDLSDCRMREASLVEADLRKAVLRRADLIGARLQNAKLDEPICAGPGWTRHCGPPRRSAARRSTSSRRWPTRPRTASTSTASECSHVGTAVDAHLGAGDEIGVGRAQHRDNGGHRVRFGEHRSALDRQHRGHFGEQ